MTTGHEGLALADLDDEAPGSATKGRLTSTARREVAALIRELERTEPVPAPRNAVRIVADGNMAPRIPASFHAITIWSPQAGLERRSGLAPCGRAHPDGPAVVANKIVRLRERPAPRRGGFDRTCVVFHKNSSPS